MNEQQRAKEELVRKQIDKVCEKNPDIRPVYYILNSKNNMAVPEQWPVIFFSKQLDFSAAVLKLKQKYKSYTHLYIFGKDSHQNKKAAEMPLNQKRKNKGKVEYAQNRQKLVHLDHEILGSKLGEVHARYKDNNNLLVIILSSEVMVTSKAVRRELKEYLFILFCAICLIFYLYLCTYSQSRISSEGMPAGDVET